MPIGLYVETNLEMRLLSILNKCFVHLTLYRFPVPTGKNFIGIQHKHLSNMARGSSCSTDLDG
jgi:hypothetical protein